MCVPRLRPAPVLDRRAPHPVLVPRRPHETVQPRAPMRPSPRRDPPRRLASVPPRPAALVHPTHLDRPRPNPDPTRPPPNTRPLRRGTSKTVGTARSERRQRGADERGCRRNGQAGERFCRFASGKRIRKREPRPGSVSTSAVPPCAAVNAATIDRPRPLPPFARVRDSSTR